MPSTVDRYIIREITVPFILGMTAFTGALLMGRFLKIAEMVVAKGVPMKDICLLLAYLFPTFTLVTIPMAFLLAILLAFGRLSSDSEIIALKAGGMGLGRLMVPVLAYASCATLITIWIALSVVPAGNRAFKELLGRTLENSANLEIQEKVFVDTIPGMTLYINSYDKASRTMNGIMIQDDRNPKKPFTIFADKGAVSMDPASRQIHFLLADGNIHNTDESAYRILNFREYELNLKLDKAISSINRNELDMTMKELDAGIRGGAKDPRLRKDMEIEYHRRYSTPFACIVFALVGVPLGIQNRRSGKGGGFAVSTGLIIIYFIVLSACKTAGEKELIHVALAMWAPNVIFLVMGGWFFLRSAQEKSVLGPLSPAAIGETLRRIFSTGSR